MTEFSGFNQRLCNGWVNEVHGTRCSLPHGHTGKCKAPYPSWICHDCGTKHGSRVTPLSTYHLGRCGWCGADKPVTSPRSYGYPDNKDAD